MFVLHAVELALGVIIITLMILWIHSILRGKETAARKALADIEKKKEEAALWEDILKQLDYKEEDTK